MNVIIAGSTGMVGKGILDLCQVSTEITQIHNLIRKADQTKESQKTNTVLIKDFQTYDDRIDIFKDIDVAFFCIGVYTGSVSDDLFKKITVDYAVNFAKR